jgi:2-dehydropantoate 2-reductase
VVLRLQNGIDASERIGRIVGADAVLVGVTYVRAGRSAPAIIDHTHSTQVILGEPTGGLSTRVTNLADLLRRAGIEAEARADSLVPMWVKFAGICGAALCALTRPPAGPVLACPDTRALVEDVIREVATVGRARGVPISDDIVDRLMAVFATYPPAARPSLLEDLEAGRRLEIESLNGTVVRLGHELGVPIPLNRAISAALKPFAGGPPSMP